MRIVFVLFLVFIFAHTLVFADEPRLSTYHETASILVDQRLSNNVTASVSLQTTSIHEFQIPPELDEKIRNSQDITAVLITNEEQCVLGVQNDVCIMFNLKRSEGQGGIKTAQQKAQDVGDSLIGDINSFFGTNARFHSMFVHYDDKSNQALGTQGQISGRGIVSAVYTMPYQDTEQLFGKISSSLIPLQIRDMGGFYNTAKALSREDTSRVTFTILPQGPVSIMQLKVAEKYPGIANQTTSINPLKFLKVDEINRSEYFSVGFFPLNSIVHVVVLPMNNFTSTPHVSSTIEPVIKNNQTVPASFETSGWFFNSNSDKKIEAMYLFGKKSSADSNDLTISFGEVRDQYSSMLGMTEILILAGIGAGAAGAIAYYLRGIKKN